MSLTDWKGLLNWTLQQVPEDTTGSKRPMNKEDVEFLQKAMESVHDHDKRVQNAAQLIVQYAAQQPDRETADKLLDAFETMELFYEEHPGNASAVHRTGMLDALVRHVKQDNRDIVAAALSVGEEASVNETIRVQLLTTTLSNNEKVQEAAAKGPLMQYLLDTREKASGTSLEPKLITAIAAATRHCLTAEKHLVEIRGLDYIMRCTAKTDPKVRQKAALLIFHFVNLKKLNKNDARRMQLLQAVQNLMPLDVAAQGIQYAEVCVNLFTAVVGKYPDAINKVEAAQIRQHLAAAVENFQELEAAKDALKQAVKALRP